MRLKRIGSATGPWIILASAMTWSLGGGALIPASPAAAAALPVSTPTAACGRSCVLNEQNAGQTLDAPAGRFLSMSLQRPMGFRWSSSISNLLVVELDGEQNPVPECPTPAPPPPGGTPPPWNCPAGPYTATLVTVGPGTATITAIAGACGAQPCSGPLHWTLVVGPALTRAPTPTSCLDLGGTAGGCTLSGFDAGLTISVGEGVSVFPLSGPYTAPILWKFSDLNGDLLDLTGNGTVFVPIRAGQDTVTAVGSCPGTPCGGPTPRLSWYLDIAAAPDPTAPSPPGTDCDTEVGCPLESFNIGATLSVTLSQSSRLQLLLEEGPAYHWSTSISDPTVLAISSEHHDPSTFPDPTYTAGLTPVHAGAARVTSTLSGSCANQPCPALLRLNWWVVVNPPGPPAAPASVFAYSNPPIPPSSSGQISVTWPPVFDHGAPIEAYAIYAFSYTGHAQMFEISGVALQTTGLESGAYYTFTVTAFNRYGWSPWSAWSNWALEP